MRVFVLLVAASALASAQTGEYRSRRAELRKALKDGVAVLFGNTEKEAGDAIGGFAQEPNFYYLTGWQEPGAVLLLDPGREILFLPRRNPEQEKWTGRKADP